MKLKLLTATLICFGVNCINWAQDTQPPPNVEELHDLLLADFNVLEEFPDNPFVWVLFFDIDHDGIPDALATYRGHDYTGSGGGGATWYYYRFKDGKWQTGPLREIEDGVIDPNTTGASLHGGFFSLTREGQKPTLVACFDDHYKTEGGIDFGLYAHELTIDSNGYLRNTHIPELTAKGFAPYDEHGRDYVLPDLGPEYDALQERLVPLSIKMFHPQEKSEGEKKQPVATTEAGGEQDAPSPNGEEQLGVRGDELQIEEKSDAEGQSKASHFWLYAGIALCVLCAVFYFLRKKRP